MAVSKRLRFEVLRRDNHACRYCGAAAPDVKLTVDHVMPTALGGSDDPANLVTACSGCNSGKSATVPDSPIVADVKADALRWAAALQQSAAAMLADLGARDELRGQFAAKWNTWKTTADATVTLPVGWQKSIDAFIGAGLPMPILLECVDIAMGTSKLKLDNIFRYFCGVAWKRVTELQEAARAAADGQPSPPAVESGAYSLLDIVDEFVLAEVVKVMGGDSRTRQLASQCLWAVAESSHKSFFAAVASGADEEEALEHCHDETSSYAAWYLHTLAEHHKTNEGATL